ncbi:cupin domain-containing protein [Ureibacillus massiliensis]|uniref:cupin domain-containing protein n=1 Tax=Ureibacillus massiliensis TaxID=292806 RepID=UPI00068FFB05|nr:cupin domain-containing protein [Ureibacillus massiliensis]
MSFKVDYSKFMLYPKNSIKVDEVNSVNGIVWKTGSEGEKIWMGYLIVESKAASTPQHHENSDTVHYVLEGVVKFYYGEGYQKFVELGKGDFIYFPPYEPYKLENESTSKVTIVTTMAPYYKLVKITESDSVVNPSGINEDLEVLIVRETELNDSTNQTDNLPRKTAVQAPNLWIGRVSGAPAKDSGAHHHGEAETAGFIVSGNTRILHGDNYEKYSDITPGDFLRVPPYLPHIERNLSETESVEFLTARNPKNIVVNLD